MKKILHFCFPLIWSVIFLGGIANAYATKTSIEKKPKGKEVLATKTDMASAIQVITAQAASLNPKVLKLALLAYEHARAEGIDEQQILTIINYHEPSTAKRLWVIDLKNDRILYNTWVAHGKGSGADDATYFSNTPQSEASSLGVFVTGETYYGNDGYSMKLHGLEPGFNNNVYNRDVVMHGAWYVSQQFIDQYGRLGRSWGCPALSKTVEPNIVNTIKNGTIIFAYYPQNKWLDDSKYLQPLA